VPWLWTRSKQIAEEALGGRVFAAVGHATHYHADYVLPYWADTLDKSVQVGRHIFYRLPGALGDARGFSQRYAGTEPPFRVPGAAVVIPPTPENEQLAKALISDGSPASGASNVEKAAPAPSPPLAVDSNRGTLLADVDGAGAPPQKRRGKSSTDCDASGERKPLAPIRADDMRASSGGAGC
jgi:hypothetical protein